MRLVCVYQVAALFTVEVEIFSSFKCRSMFVGCRLLMLMDMEPENEKIYFNLGMLSMDDKKFKQAQIWFDKAIQVMCLNTYLSLSGQILFNCMLWCSQKCKLVRGLHPLSFPFSLFSPPFFHTLPSLFLPSLSLLFLPCFAHLSPLFFSFFLSFLLSLYK